MAHKTAQLNGIRVASVLTAAAVLGAACGAATTGAPVTATHRGSPAHVGNSGSTTTSPGHSSTTTTQTTHLTTTQTTQPQLSEAPPAPAPVPATPGKDELAASQIPWSHVGSGWTLALWSPTAKSYSVGAQASSGSTLYLLDPSGHRYAEANFQSGYWAQISDWSGDKHHALLTVVSDSNDTSGQNTETVVDVDLTDGNAVGRFGVDYLTNVEFTHPEGTALLVSYGQTIAALARTSISGTVEETYPGTFATVGTANGSGLYTADGTELVMGAAHGLAVVGNGGAVFRELPVENGITGGCTPDRWWSADTLLASCTQSAGQYFWLVPVGGGTATRLQPNMLGPDNNIWQTPAGTYSQTGACATILIVKLDAKGNWANFLLPGVRSDTSQVIVGTYGNLLEAIASPDCEMGQKNPPVPALYWYDPATNSTSAILGADVNGGTVDGALAYRTEP